ncbi:MAG: universal stress protein [Bacteroidales bacterium]|nr:universal stress protein [Bacteroidales bacterium]
MKKILVPVDFSNHTATSIRYARNIARVTGSEIILFHSFFDQIYFSNGGFSTGFESGMMLTDQIIRDFYRQKEEGLQKLADELITGSGEKGDAGIKVSTKTESGDPEVQIMQTIGQVNPDLIVMGSGGMGKKSLLSGSIARKIMNNAETPVIAVPELNVMPTIGHVAYMTNFDNGDIMAIRRIQSVLAGFPLNIHCLHLCQQGENEEAAIQLQKLAGSKELKKMKSPVSFQLLDAEDMRVALKNFIASNHISLIAFIPHKRNVIKNLLYQGLTKEDLFLTQTPVMAIQPGE